MLGDRTFREYLSPCFAGCRLLGERVVSAHKIETLLHKIDAFGAALVQLPTIFSGVSALKEIRPALRESQRMIRHIHFNRWKPDTAPETIDGVCVGACGRSKNSRARH